jgi:hypothetical protein
VSTIEELLEKKSSDSGLETELLPQEIRRADYATPLHPQKLALNSLTRGGRSVGIVRSRTQATERVIFIFSLPVHISIVKIFEVSTMFNNCVLN